MNIKTLLVNSTKTWRVILCARNSELGEVDNKQGIFQGVFKKTQKEYRRNIKEGIIIYA